MNKIHRVMNAVTRITPAALGLVLSALMIGLLAGVPNAQAEELKIGFVYVGPIGDHGWTYQHDQGRLDIEKEFGDRVSTTFVEKVPEGADAERVINRLASSGHKLIFTTSFGFMNPTVKVARSYPRAYFEHATGYKRGKNVSTYMGRWYEGRYISGVIAGKLTRSNVIGYVGSFPIPEVIRGINAFALGMRTVNPEAKIRVIWVSSWFDPGKEADAAKTLLDQGADILAQHTDSPAPIQVAQERGAKAFGQASDMIQFGPKAQLTAVIDEWGSYYVARTRAVLDGKWKSTNVWGGMADGLVKMAPYTNMPSDVAALARQVENDIRSGRVNPFQGPIYDQGGKVILPAGKILGDDKLLGMSQYVMGVEGKPPK